MGAQTSSARATSATRLRERDEAYAFARFVRSLSVVDATRASRAAELAHFCEYMSQQSIASPKTSHRQIYSDISNILRRVDTPLRPSSNVERLFARSLLGTSRTSQPAKAKTDGSRPQQDWLSPTPNTAQIVFQLDHKPFAKEEPVQKGNVQNAMLDCHGGC